MASYRVEWKLSARKELRKLPRELIGRIVSATGALADVPHPPGSRKLKGSEHTYRIRLGDYRVIYSVRSEVLCIEIIRVGHRKAVYR